MVMSSARFGLKTGSACETELQPQTTNLSSRQRGLHHIEKTTNVKIIYKEVKEKFVADPRRRSDSRTDWPTDRQS
jgi:hypothetical protein